MSQCKSRIRTADLKIKSVSIKYGASLKKRNAFYEGKINTVKTTGSFKDLNNPALKTLLYGITARDEKTALTALELQESNLAIAQLKSKNKQRLEQLGTYLGIADSALVNETIERIRMHDNYDDEVKGWMDMVKTNKYELADTLHRQYISGYDAVLTAYEAQKKLENIQLEARSNNLRDLEQYRRYNNSNTDIIRLYKKAHLYT